MVCSDISSDMEVPFSSSFYSNIGAKLVLQELLTGLLYSPEILSV